MLNTNRRQFLENSTLSALLLLPASLLAQDNQRKADGVEKNLTKLDATSGNVTIEDESSKGAKIADSRSKMTVRIGERSHTVIVYAGKTPDEAVIELDGEIIRVSQKSAFKTTGSAANAKSANDFWGCFAASMIAQIGQGAWNNIKNNYQNIWNSTSGIKPWWKRLAKILQMIFTLPYASYALIALKNCK